MTGTQLQCERSQRDHKKRKANNIRLNMFQLLIASKHVPRSWELYALSQKHHRHLEAVLLYVTIINEINVDNQHLTYFSILSEMIRLKYFVRKG